VLQWYSSNFLVHRNLGQQVAWLSASLTHSSLVLPVVALVTPVLTINVSLHQLVKGTNGNPNAEQPPTEPEYVGYRRTRDTSDVNLKRSDHTEAKDYKLVRCAPTAHG